MILAAAVSTSITLKAGYLHLCDREVISSNHSTQDIVPDLVKYYDERDFKNVNINIGPYEELTIMLYDKTKLI